MWWENIPLADLTAPTLLGFAILLVLVGWIVPRRTLVDKAIEADRWRQAYEYEREARAASDQQTEELLEVAKTTHALIVAVFSNSERIRQSGETDAGPQSP